MENFIIQQSTQAFIYTSCEKSFKSLNSPIHCFASVKYSTKMIAELVILTISLVPV